MLIMHLEFIKQLIILYLIIKRVKIKRLKSGTHIVLLNFELRLLDVIKFRKRSIKYLIELYKEILVDYFAGRF